MKTHDRRQYRYACGHRRSLSWIARAAALLVIATGLGAAHGQGVQDPHPIRVAHFDVDGAGERSAAAGNIRRCLSPSPDFTFQTLTADDIRGNALSRFDVLICPGGSGSRQARALGQEGGRAIRDFVQRGGGYVGFCAGAYLASCQFPWSLGLLNAHVVDTEHWARGMGSVSLKMTAEGCRLLGTPDETVTCYYAQGPLLIPANRTDLPPYQLLATFASEMAKKGAPSGVMIGTTAIAAGTYGKGRVFCFSPHPEKTQGLEGLVRRAARWAAGQDLSSR